MISLNTKLENLKSYLQSLDKAVVAFSGGTDSTLLLNIAHDVMSDRVTAVKVISDFCIREENTECNNFCKEQGIKYIKIKLNILSNKKICSNPANRCYFCKKKMFSLIKERVKEMGSIKVLDGTNLDDIKDFRPGLKALSELNIVSPFKDFGFTKKDIRLLCRKYKLKVSEKPSSACLASRIEYGQRITKEKLNRIQKAETLIKHEGFSLVRVRLYGESARIEINKNKFRQFVMVSENIYKKLKKLGFDYVTLDLGGYRTGSVNEVIFND